MAGDLPDSLKLLCWHIADSARSATGYEWGWVAKTELARRQGLSARQIGRQLQIVRELGIFKIELLGVKAWRMALWSRYGYSLPRKISGAQFLGFTMNWSHGVWSQGTLSKDELALLKTRARHSRF